MRKVSLKANYFLKYGSIILPALCFFTASAVLLIEPRLFIFIFAAFLCLLGFVVVWLAIKLNRFKRFLASVGAQLQAKVVVDQAALLRLQKQQMSSAGVSLAVSAGEDANNTAIRTFSDLFLSETLNDNQDVEEEELLLEDDESSKKDPKSHFSVVGGKKVVLH